MRLAPVAALLLSLLVAPSAPAYSAPDDPRGPAEHVVLLDDVADTSGRGSVRKWPGHKITYSETLPFKWRWSLKKALKAWNTSGGKLKFVKAKNPGQADLKIGYGNTNGYAGFATVGPARNAFVHLHPGYKPGRVTTEERVFVGLLLTHELGHVVGFGHVGGGCELMVQAFDSFNCPLFANKEGYYACRWIDKPLLRSFVAAYGGKGKPAPKSCPIDPIPPQLKSFLWSGGETVDAPVTAMWKAVDSKRDVRVRVSMWELSTCGYGPERTWYVSTKAGAWVDPSDGFGGPHCFRVQVVNESGGGPSADSKVISRWQQPPAAPVISNPGYNVGNDEFTFTATWPADTGLYAYVADSGSACATDFENSTYYVFDHSSPLVIPADRAELCVVFMSRTEPYWAESTHVTQAFFED